MILRVRCPAKVNLFLEVLARRADGYHEISTVLQAVALFDTVEIARAEAGLSLEVAGADLPGGAGNLVHEAARLFLARHAPGASLRLRLTKRIPVAAGLGGGSSDAAGTLKGLRALLRPDLPEEEILPLAAELGSDVPFFLGPPAALAGGRGERLTPLRPAPETWLVLLTPGFGLRTAGVYRAVRVPDAADRRDPGPVIEALAAGAPPWPHGFNRLEEAAAAIEPRLAACRESWARRLGPAEPLLLSGSGSTFWCPAAGLARAAEIARAVNAAGPGRALAVRTLDATPAPLDGSLDDS